MANNVASDYTGLKVRPVSNFAQGANFFSQTSGDRIFFPNYKILNLASIRFGIHTVFKNFHPGERTQKVADSYAGLTG